MPIGVLGQTDTARISNSFQPRSDIDAIAHQIAVDLLDNIAEVNTDPKFDTALGRKASIALDHAVLHLDGAANGIDYATKLDDAAVAGAFDHATVMDTDGRGDQIAPERPQPCQRTFLVAARRRLKPTTSAARIAASLRCSVMAAPSQDDSLTQFKSVR